MAGSAPACCVSPSANQLSYDAVQQSSHRRSASPAFSRLDGGALCDS
jgi:hypothetical protein